MKQETRIWMSMIGNFIAIGLFVNVPLYVSALYYEQKRQEVYADITFIVELVNAVLYVMCGWALSKTNESNRIDFKLQTLQLVIVIVAHVLFIIGYEYKFYLMQDVGMAGLSMNLLMIINFAMIARGLQTLQSRHAGFLIGIYTLCGSCAVITMNGLGGYLFKLNPVLPFMAVSLPAATLFFLITLINLICW